MSYGTFCSFNNQERFLNAFRTLKKAGFDLETFTPYAIEETIGEERIGEPNPVKKAALGGACVGVILGFGMQWIANVLQTPLNIGGRPLNSWPSFIPVSWVMTVLCTGLSVFISLWWKLGLPKPYQPIFNARAYQLGPERFGILIRNVPPGLHMPSQHLLEAATMEEVPW